MKFMRKFFSRLLSELAALLFLMAVALYLFADWFGKPTPNEAKR